MEPIKQIWPDTDFNTLQYESMWGKLDSAFKVSMKASNLNENPEKLEMRWNVTEITTRSMSIKIDFNDPLYVSLDDADIVLITFLDADLFITETGIRIKPEDRQLSRRIMRQLPDEALSVQIKIDEAIIGAKWTTYAVMALTGAGDVSMQGLFNMVEALQLIVYLPLFDVSFPANSQRVFDSLSNIAAYDIYEIGDHVNQFLDLDPTEPINEKYESIGFESLYFINNLGTFTVTVLLFQAVLTLWVLLWLLNSFIQVPCVNRMKEKIK